MLAVMVYWPGNHGVGGILPAAVMLLLGHQYAVRMQILATMMV